MKHTQHNKKKKHGKCNLTCFVCKHKTCWEDLYCEIDGHLFCRQICYKRYLIKLQKRERKKK
jgi:hypothetical protein